MILFKNRSVDCEGAHFFCVIIMYNDLYIYDNQFNK